MCAQLYLDDSLRKKYIDDLTILKDMFFERVQPAFANAESEANAYKDELWESIASQSCEVDDNVDLSDEAVWVEEESFERYKLLSLMHYRNLAAWICNLCQVWEQQLYAFIVREAQSEGLKYDAEEIKSGFKFSKAVFKWHQQSFDKMDMWDKVQELRWLVNVIKHAEGSSEQKLRKVRPEFFKDEGYDLMSLYHTSLLEKTLMVKEQDFCDYYKALVEFWMALPERMYTEEDIEDCHIKLFKENKDKKNHTKTGCAPE